MKNSFLFLVLVMFSITLNAQSIISSSTTFTQNDADGYSWPIIISGGTSSDTVVITLGEDILLEQVNKYFVIGSAYVTFEGNNKTVTIDNVTDYPGLVQNGDGGAGGYSNVTVSNIKVHSNNSGLLESAGWIGQNAFAYGLSNVLISNCSSDGPIARYCGGITGGYSYCTVINSHSSGENIYASGGIFGAFSFGTAINCYSTGTINEICGGIFGYNCESTATDCYSTGTIGNYGGGIFGYVSTSSATRCYSTGNIGQYAGGIGGREFYGTIDNCYSTGDIGDYGGGITGWNNSGSVSNCYSTGSISPDAGGIAGANSSGTITNSFAENGPWNDDNAAIYLTGSDGTAWTDINLTSPNIPYKLTSFNAGLYDPATESAPPQAFIYSPTGTFTTGNYSIISINDLDPSLAPSVTINASNGELGFTSTAAGTFSSKILYEDTGDGSYSISNYTLNVLGTLPVTWRSFTATARGNAAWLQWSTASEQNTRDFNVQHGIDGSNWTTIATVRAAGNSTGISNYSYLHADPVNANNYYRIQQTGQDGKYSYSSIRQLAFDVSNKSFSLINTVVSNGVLQVEVKASALLYLFDDGGKLIWQKQFNTGLQAIDLSTASKGVYFLKGNDTVEKIVVQ